MQAPASAALQALAANSAKRRGQQLDRIFLRRRRAAAGATASRRWYQDLDSWLAGTTVEADAAPAFFQELVRPLPPPAGVDGRAL